MPQDRDPMESLTFHADRRGSWRATWVLGWAFGAVAWWMQRDGAATWPLFAALAALLLGIGVSALLSRRASLVAVGRAGLRLYAGSTPVAIPWSAIEGVAVELRPAARARGEAHPMEVPALLVRLSSSAPSPDSGGALSSPLADRCAARALGEHWLWNPRERVLELLEHPHGGLHGLTAAIAQAEPRLGDASAGRRRGLGGPLAYAVFDAGLALAVLGSLALWATEQMR